MVYENQFKDVHQLLKDYGCKPTFTFEPEFKKHPILAGACFYKPESEMHNDKFLPEWRERVDAKLDVCIKTKKGFSEKDLIRFDIQWCLKKNLFSMYISSLTSSRSISLSRNIYKSQKAVMIEVSKWLVTAGCRKVFQNDAIKSKGEEFKQMSLF